MDIKKLMLEPYPLRGIPFEYGGRGPKSFDCWGLVMEVYRRFGVELPDYAICQEQALTDNADKIDERMEELRWKWEKSDGSIIPSLLPIRFHNVVYKNHVGIYIGNGQFIHTRNKVGVYIDRVDSPAWERKIDGYYIYKGGE